jgi:Right handed beta helix region
VEAGAVVADLGQDAGAGELTQAGLAGDDGRVGVDQVAIADSAAALPPERGSGTVEVNGLTLTGGSDGIVALSATKDVVLRNLVTAGVAQTAVRTFSTGLQIIDSRITGGTTGVATTIIGTTIDDAEEGIRFRSADLVDVDNATVSALSVGINVAPGSRVQLAGSHIDALEATRGTLDQDGINDLSLPPLNVLGAIGVPLVLLALVLEQVHAFRQRSTGRAGRRMPPSLPAGNA